MKSRSDTETVALANADYEDRKTDDGSHRLTVRVVEREWKIKKNQLVNYRANRQRRRDSGVRVHPRRGASDIGT